MILISFLWYIYCTSCVEKCPQQSKSIENQCCVTAHKLTWLQTALPQLQCDVKVFLLRDHMIPNPAHQQNRKIHIFFHTDDIWEVSLCVLSLTVRTRVLTAFKSERKSGEQVKRWCVRCHSLSCLFVFSLTCVGSLRTDKYDILQSVTRVFCQ